MIALVLSIMANIFFGIISVVLMKSLKWQNQVKSGSPDVSLYGESATADDSAKSAKFQLTESVSFP